MGYSEVLCQICGVSFNIGRTRRFDEPRSAAWNREGPIMKRSLWEYYPFDNRFASFADAPPCQDTGCMFVDREPDDNASLDVFDIAHSRPTKNLQNEHEDSDADWIPESGDEEDDEPLEYSSEDDEQPLETDTRQIKDFPMTDDDESTEETEDMKKESIREFWLDTTTYTQQQVEKLARDYDNYQGWYSGAPYHIKFDVADSIQKQVDTFHHPIWPEDPAPADPSPLCAFVPDDSEFVEHIAGPSCEYRGAYSGYEISAEEMRGCQTLQCLVRKDSAYPFEQLPDDEEFEIKGSFFLSGLSDHMPSRDCYPPSVIPARRMCYMPTADNAMYRERESDPHEYAMPFHPSCLEVFKHASKFLKNKVDINALTSWYSLEANPHHFETFPRHADVNLCVDQWWLHHPGTAYIVANPLYVPKLQEIFTSATDTDPVFNPRDGAFPTRPPPSTPAPNDPFASLPAELLASILDLLPSKAIAALRLTSRAFSHLPIIYFQNLLHREMPWLWEAWPTLKRPFPQTKYATWATLTASQVPELFEKPDRDISRLEDYIEIVTQEMPELESHFTDEVVALEIAAINAAHQDTLSNIPDRNPFFLPPDRTNYYKLYTLITRHWNELRGLRNRERIWKDCEEILRRADEHKREGRMDENGITQDLEDIVTQNEAFWKEKFAKSNLH
ncbi:hypothetical protein DM02DRAFT_674456 [Periconia macrospinosa]|uniref:F-box domain-containing protein n=1 Tax=Periconia macrospinosa TaxID=97972 RepID=A0A2V1DI75_9PLEO|nr:hypothetical protein DM02DRAFT_674456 [Periconia macrospinosa]